MRTSAVGSEPPPRAPRLCPQKRRPRPRAALALRQAGFTLLELVVVVAIIAIGTAGVSFALRDGSQDQLEREAQRLAALLESARAQSRANGVPVLWHATAEGFRFEGLPEAASKALPQRWLGGDVALAGEVTALQLGPEPLIGPQAVVLTSRSRPGFGLRVATDGLRPFTVSAR